MFRLLSLIFLLPVILAPSQALAVAPRGFWNGFNQHTNVIECNNRSSEQRTITITVYSNSGSVIASPSQEIPSLGTRHFLLEQQLVDGRYGSYTVSTDGGSATDINCFTVLYRFPSEPGIKPLEYALALPLFEASTGKRSGIFNSIDPSGGVTPVQNWLSLFNPGASALTLLVTTYGMDGSLVSTVTVSDIAPLERRDIALGHEQGQVVGSYLVEGAPADAPFIAFLSRYGAKSPSKFSFAFSLTPRSGSCDDAVLAASTFGSAFNWGELLNVSNTPLSLEVELLDQTGSELFQGTLTLSPNEQYHLPLHQYLGPNNVGSLHVRCLSDSQGFVAQSMYYGRLLGSLSTTEWAYASQGGVAGASGESLSFAPVNTFLGALNWQKVLNGSSSALELTAEVYGQEGDQLATTSVLAPEHGSKDLGLHELTGADVIGLVSYSLANGTSAHTTELIRVFPTSGGEIGYILNVPLSVSYLPSSGGSSSSPGSSSSASSSSQGSAGSSSVGSSSSISSSVSSSSSSVGSSSSASSSANQPPVANVQNVSVTKNVPTSIILAGSDPENAPLTYSIFSSPTHGSLTGSGANRTYTPDNNYVGPDSFSFRVSDGTLLSQPATVSIDVVGGGGGGQSCSSVSQHGITWMFNQAYQCGQFANGDWWVLGPVTVTSITPAFSGGRNGWQVNPTTTVQHGYDSRSGQYNATLVPSLPYVAAANTSIIKAISNAGTSCSYNSFETCYLDTAAVLTVLGAIPPNNGATVFRPPYYGTQKPLYSTTALEQSALPSLNPNAQVLAQAPTLAQVVASFERVQLDYPDWTNREIHPQLNMPNYGGDIGQQSNRGVLRLMLNDSWNAKLPSLIAVVQSGIDHVGLVQGGVSYTSNGGQGVGRKILVTFAGMLLNDSSMKLLVSSASQSTFGENGDVIQGRNGYLWGQSTCTESLYWAKVANPNINGSNTCIDPYGYIDGGYSPGGGYQQITSNPGIGSALAVHLLQAQSVWNNASHLDYVDRWADHGTWALPDPCAPLSQGGGPNPSRPGECILDPDLTPGSTFTSFSCQSGMACGRFPNQHGSAGGGYGSSFVDVMWSNYR